MSKPTDADRWLSVKEAAARLNISTRKLYELVAEGRVPFRRPPGTTMVRFAPADMAAIEKASAVAATARRAVA